MRPSHKQEIVDLITGDLIDLFRHEKVDLAALNSALMLSDAGSLFEVSGATADILFDVLDDAAVAFRSGDLAFKPALDHVTLLLQRAVLHQRLLMRRHAG